MSLHSRLILLFGLLLFPRGAIAPPTNDTLSGNTSDWSNTLAISPAAAALHDKRTVVSIVWSCLATLLACCWTAVHPNMLEEKATFKATVWHHLKHMIYMIIFPEVIFSWALRQWFGAVALMVQAPYNNAYVRGTMLTMWDIPQYSLGCLGRYCAKKLRERNNLKSGPHQLPPNNWSMTHGYFLQMGGFVLEGTSHILSEVELTDLLNKGLVALPKVTAEEINDRSKRDAFSKAIATGQTTWFLLQCLTRKIEGLVTTELELVTVAYAVFNIFVNFFWWEKPKDAQTRVPIVYLSTQRDNKGALLSLASVNSLAKIPLKPTNTQAPAAPLVSPGPNLPSKKTNHSVDILDVDKPQDVEATAMATCLSTDCDNTEHLSNTVDQTQSKTHPEHADIQTSLIEAQNPSGQASATSKPRNCLVSTILEVGDVVLSGRFMHPGKNRVSMFYSCNPYGSRKGGLIFFAGAFAVYFGAIHCIGWHDHFPTYAEAIIWRVSCIMITVTPWLSSALIATYLDSDVDVDEQAKETVLWIGVFFLILHIVARILLLVEAFISLRDLPPDALLAIRWTSFLPHV